MPVTQRQITQLAPYLEGDKPTHTNKDTTREWNLKCPIHPDNKRSASLNLDKGVFFCNVCGGMPVTALIRRQSEWLDPGARRNGSRPTVNGRPDDKPQVILNEAMIKGWHSALVANQGALQWLQERRGINMQTVLDYEIGFKDNRLYTIPIRGIEDEIWNVRYYNPHPTGEARKIWSTGGYGSPPRIYPIKVLNSKPDYCIIGAGEWDALLALQFNFIQITRTAGENHWNNEWNEFFEGMRVYVVQDADDEGEKANRYIARQLLPVGAEVYIPRLPFPLERKHGKDVTDLLLDQGPEAYQQILDDAPRFEKRSVREKAAPEDIETVTVLDTFDARRVGQPVKVIVTIKGRKEPGYVVPKKVLLACDQKAGNKCQSCPLNAVRGEATVEITPDDPAVLAMVESETAKLHQVIADAYGIPGGRCQRLVQEVEEHQAVEVLFARPALDYSDGTKAGEYKNITLTSVGHHDTLANNTVAAIGALQPSPRSQRNEFLVHELEVLETSVDRFELNSNTIKLMKLFQAGKRGPLAKQAEISKALAEHVTLIQGRPEMHALMDLTFHSILNFKFGGETLTRGWLEALILGDTGTGKSSAATRLIRHYGAGEIVTCEAATFAGIVGGVQQMGGKDWAVTWGVVPINDKRLVVLDEISGLTTEEIAQMSDIRSSGQAKLIKVVQETTWARCRLLWMGNPRDATMENFTYGVNALRPLVGNAEDIARFDLVMAVTKYDVPAEIINQRREGSELRYTSEACHALLMWAWTRQPEDVVWERNAEQKVYDLANELGKIYVEDPPLVLAASIRIKIARIAVALAARTFSTDASYERVVVTRAHIEDAVRFMNLVYGMPAFGYRERSREILADRHEALSKAKDIKQYLVGRPLLAKHLRNAGKFRRQDLEELMNISREEANGIINTLYEARMVRRILGDIYVEPTLHTLLREIKV